MGRAQWHNLGPTGPTPRGMVLTADKLMTGLLEWLSNTSFSVWLQESPSIWGFPLALTFHTTGMGVLVGAAWAIAFRLLGFAKGIPLAEMRVLCRVVWWAFWVNVVSGVVMFIAHPVERGLAPMFWIKIALVAVGMVIQTRTERLMDSGDAATATSGARQLGYASLVVWLLAVTAARLIAYVGGNG